MNYIKLKLGAIGILIGIYIILLFWANLALIAIMGLITVGLIETYLIYKKEQVITNWYIPLLPKSIDMPIAIAVPIALVIKAAWIWTNKEPFTVWWVSAAIITSWIIAHLCSYERK